MMAEKDTVLYIDDDLLNLEIFKEYFEDDYNVIILSSTEKALDVLRNNPVKVLITDQFMPYESGIDFIQRIVPEFPDIIKMILTAYTDHDVALDAINRVGVYKYLLKPWDSTEVSNSIATGIREYNLKKENKQLLVELKQKNDALNLAFSMLEENEKKFRTIFSNSNDSIYIINHEKQIIEANRSFYNLLGINAETSGIEDVNRLVCEKFASLVNVPYDLLSTSGLSISETEIKPNLSETRIIELNCNEINYSDKRYILSVARDISERRMFEKRIVEAIIQTQEEDQGKYARELHDGLGPLLSTLKMHIEWIADPNNSNNKDKIIHHSIHTIDNAIRSIKEIANNMSPHILQRFGLVNAINSHIEHLKESSAIEFVLSSNLKERIPNNIEVILYRIILECINNAIKHSDAKKVILKFNKQKDILTITYSDNGKGFDVKEAMNKGKGMGLFNMQNRVKHIGGEFKIISNPDIGTDITIRIDI